MEIEIRRSDEGLTLETSAFLRWLIYVFNPVVNTKLPAIQNVLVAIFKHKQNLLLCRQQSR